MRIARLERERDGPTEGSKRGERPDGARWSQSKKGRKSVKGRVRERGRVLEEKNEKRAKAECGNREGNGQQVRERNLQKPGKCP